MHNEKMPPVAKDTPSGLASAIYQLRTALHESQEKFAQRLGVSIATVVRYEHNQPPRANSLAKLEQVAAAEGLEEYAEVFRRALSKELRGPKLRSAALHIKRDLTEQAFKSSEPNDTNVAAAEQESQNSELVSAVRQLRVAVADTQQQFARRLGVSIATLVRYEHNRPPRGKALLRLEQVAEAHGLQQYAALFRRALSNELGGSPPSSPGGLTLQLQDEEEKKWVAALLHVFRNSESPEASAVKSVLNPVVIKQNEEADFTEALETTKNAIIRLLKNGHSAEEVKKRLGISAEKIAEAFFARCGPHNAGKHKDQMSEIVQLLLDEGWTVRRMTDEFGQVDANEFIACAAHHGNKRAIQEYKKENAKR